MQNTRPTPSERVFHKEGSEQSAAAGLTNRRKYRTSRAKCLNRVFIIDCGYDFNLGSNHPDNPDLFMNINQLVKHQALTIIDTHCHLDAEEFDTDRLQVLDNARHAGVSGIVVPGIARWNWENVARLCREQADLYPAYGLHPIYLAQHRPEHVSQLREWVEREKPVAIGEIGLDFYIQKLDREAQRRLFEQQLGVAADTSLPVLLHIRKAYDEVLKSLKRVPVSGGICHAFNGSLEQARQFMDRGFLLGFGGMLTYPRSSKLRRLARELPLECLVLETDAPDMTVASHQYQRNSPEYLPEVLQVLSELRGQSPQLLAAETSANARRILGLPERGH